MTVCVSVRPSIGILAKPLKIAEKEMENIAYPLMNLS